jgi:hypothetical protein
MIVCLEIFIPIGWRNLICCKSPQSDAQAIFPTLLADLKLNGSHSFGVRFVRKEDGLRTFNPSFLELWD